MRNLRRTLTLLLALCMALSLLASASAAEPARSGTVGDSNVTWSLSSSGRLTIGGSGGAARFASPEDQPWADFREEVREVWFADVSDLAIADLAYWFAGCTSLISAEVPYTTPVVGTDAFAECPNLERILFYYQDANFTITPGAFAVGEMVETQVLVPAGIQSAAVQVALYDWPGDNRHIRLADMYGMRTLASCAITGCSCTDCSSTYTYSVRGDDPSKHNIYVICADCDTSVPWYVGYRDHTGNPCTLCGYSGPTVCYHTSTYTTWSGCHWYEYCRSCGDLVDSGTSHSSYVYGSWQYYSASQHRRYASCSACGEGSYSYGSHTQATRYSQDSASQHTVTTYCPTCGGTLSTSRESHSYTYGSWASYSSSQHRRTQTCSACGYSTYDYGSHSDGNGDGRCDSCSYSMSVTITWDLGDGNTQTTQQAYGENLVLPAQPQRDGYTFLGWFTDPEGGEQVTGDTIFTATTPTTYYAWWELIPVFSVTVPVSLALTVSEQGEVYAASNAEIVNRSTAAVQVTGITVSAVNGWTLVPYDTDMARQKVDSRLIGFTLNGAVTAGRGTTETLALTGDWTVPLDGSLPLTYDAVVSAIFQPVDEQVVSIVFGLEWV